MGSKRQDRTEALPVTTARAHLFDLVEDVLTGRRSRVELSHRNYDEHVLVIRKAEVEGLEADLKAVRSRIGPEPRPLQGMGRLNVDPEQILIRVRERQDELAAQKRASLLGAQIS